MFVPIFIQNPLIQYMNMMLKLRNSSFFPSTISLLNLYTCYLSLKKSIFVDALNQHILTE
jgi:hypothetical protein